MREEEEKLRILTDQGKAKRKELSEKSFRSKNQIKLIYKNVLILI